MQYLGIYAMFFGPFAAIGAVDLRAWHRNRSFDRHCRRALRVVA